MASRVPLIAGFDCRLDTARLEKLEYIADHLSAGNKSKAMRKMIDFFAEYIAEETHQIDAGSRCI